MVLHIELKSEKKYNFGKPNCLPKRQVKKKIQKILILASDVIVQPLVHTLFIIALFFHF